MSWGIEMDFYLMARTHAYNTFGTEWTMRMGQLYKALCDDGLLRTFFYDCPPELSLLEFFDYAEDPQRWLYAAYDAESHTPLAFAVCNGFTGRAALSHFCFLAAGRGRRHAIARHWLDHVCNEGALSCLMGVTPAPYRHVVRFAEGLGYRRITNIKDGCEMYRSSGERVYRDAVVLQYEHRS